MSSLPLPAFRRVARHGTLLVAVLSGASRVDAQAVQVGRPWHPAPVMRHAAALRQVDRRESAMRRGDTSEPCAEAGRRPPFACTPTSPLPQPLPQPPPPRKSRYVLGGAAIGAVAGGGLMALHLSRCQDCFFVREAMVVGVVSSAAVGDLGGRIVYAVVRATR